MILIVIVIIIAILLIVMKIKDKKSNGEVNRDSEMSKKLKISSNILLGSIIILFASLLLRKMIGLDSLFTIIMYISLSVGAVALIISTVISIKDKEKVPLWISLVQGIVVAVIVISCISAIIDGNREKREKENINQITEQLLDANPYTD